MGLYQPVLRHHILHRKGMEVKGSNPKHDKMPSNHCVCLSQEADNRYCATALFRLVVHGFWKYVGGVHHTRAIKNFRGCSEN